MSADESTTKIVFFALFFVLGVIKITFLKLLKYMICKMVNSIFKKPLNLIFVFFYNIATMLGIM